MTSTVAEPGSAGAEEGRKPARGRERDETPRRPDAGAPGSGGGLRVGPGPRRAGGGPPGESDAPLASVQDALSRPALAEEDEARGEGSLEAEVVAFDDARPERRLPVRQAAVAGAAPPPEPRADAGELAGAASARDALAVPRLESRERRANTASGGQPEDVKAFGQLTRDDAEGAAAWRERREVVARLRGRPPGEPARRRGAGAGDRGRPRGVAGGGRSRGPVPSPRGRRGLPGPRRRSAEGTGSPGSRGRSASADPPATSHSADVRPGAPGGSGGGVFVVLVFFAAGARS